MGGGDGRNGGTLGLGGIVNDDNLLWRMATIEFLPIDGTIASPLLANVCVGWWRRQWFGGAGRSGHGGVI